MYVGEEREKREDDSARRLPAAAQQPPEPDKPSRLFGPSFEEFF